MSAPANEHADDSDGKRLGTLVKRIPKYLSLTRRLLADPGVPAKSKAFLGVGGLYAVSPIDLVPGIIPVAGQLDDAYILLYGLRRCLNSIPNEMATFHLQAADISMQDIDDDIALVINIAKRIGRLVITTGVQIGRAGRTTFQFARSTVRRR